MVEPEMAYATLEDVMNLSERMLSYIAAQVLEKRSEELKCWSATLEARSDRDAPSRVFITTMR